MLLYIGERTRRHETGGEGMTDGELVELLWQRREEALERVQEKYAPWCRAIARNILGREEDVEECLSDCWFQLWNAIPPARPVRFQGYLGAVVRNRALLLRKRLGRRADTVSLAALELADCLPAREGPEEAAQGEALGRAVSQFLRDQGEGARTAFLRRYWYADTVEETARFLGWSVPKTKSVLSRTRKKLRAYLEQEGWL